MRSRQESGACRGLSPTVAVLASFGFVALGGEQGALMQELREYFYYVQLRRQGLGSMAPREVSNPLPLIGFPQPVPHKPQPPQPFPDTSLAFTRLHVAAAALMGCRCCWSRCQSAFPWRKLGT